MSDDAVIDGIVALLPPLLQSLEALAYVSRYLHPPEFGELMQLIGHPDEALRPQVDQLTSWPDTAVHLQGPLRVASEHALAAFDGLRAVESGRGELVELFGALRHLPQALEALYPLTAALPPIASFFLDPDLRSAPELAARLAGPKHPDSGVFHQANELTMRGGFSLYVPEDYTPERAWPLVMALHGGAGHGRLFLWSWLRDARSRGAIVVAPTALGRTWALMGDDIDTPNLSRILAQIAGAWHIDASRLLLTGFSDGGTFCYLSGLDSESPFTHLAPVSASFHPLIAGMADASRMRALPIQIAHGVHDWMFPVELARQARDALFAAGADVSYREIADLSHSYPREINAELLTWIGE